MQQMISMSDPRTILEEVLHLRSEVIDEARTDLRNWPTISRRSSRCSAFNFAVYLALRRRNLQSLHQALLAWGLSITHSETAAISNLDAVIAALHAISGNRDSAVRRSLNRYFRGERRLQHNAAVVFGPCPAGRSSRIMVTLPLQAAVEYTLVKRLISAGMSVVRINCAHGSRRDWDAMIAHVHHAERETGKSCKILMDLCGTKARIATLQLIAGDGRLNTGDQLLLTKELPRQADVPVMITCTLPQMIDFLEIGDPVMIDDGVIAAEVSRLVPGGVIITVRKTKPKGTRLKLQRGINFPQTVHTLAPLTAQDLLDLDFILEKADMIGYSFVRGADDLSMLQDEMEKRGGSRARAMPIIAKIETARAIESLPKIIAQGISRQPFCLMIARGDLAVELGFDRLPVLQEKVLSCARAAHIPTIWATQVLESLVKKGLPCRAEMTDVAQAVRSDCIMLNKGPFLPEAVRFLDDILSH